MKTDLPENSLQIVTMMYYVLIVALLAVATITNVFAFIPSLRNTPKVIKVPASWAPSRVALNMVAAEAYPGGLPPMGFFDPWYLSRDLSSREIKRFREAELKHGRLAMLAVVGWLTAEVFHPFFAG